MVPRVKMLTTKNWAARCSVFLLLAWVFAGCTPKGPKALLDGKKLIEAGRYDEAVEKLQLATSLIGTNAVAWNYLGLAYHHSGQSTNAERAYVKALSLDRNLAEAYYNLGTLRLEEERLEPARMALIAYTALKGNSVEGWIKLAGVQLRLREPATAEKSYQEAIGLDPTNVEALNGLGLVQLQRRDAREAAAFFNKALKERPDYGPALLNLAILNHTSFNNRPMALQKYREYLSLPNRPEDWETVNQTAAALDRELNHQVPAAVGAQVPPATQNVTLVQSRATNVVKSQSTPAIQAPAVTRPEPITNAARSVPVQTNRVPVQIAKIPPEQVVRPARDVAPPRSAIQTSPSVNVTAPSVNGAAANTNKPGFFRKMNPLRVFRGDSQNHSRATTKLPDNSPTESNPKPDSPYPRYKYQNPPTPPVGDSSAAARAFAQGTRAQQSGRLADAIQFYREATRLDPAHFDAYYNLAVASAASGNLSQALTTYETALAIRPESLDARYNFAVTLRQSNHVTDAVREFEQVLARYPREARAHIGLGNLYAQQLRQPAKAREHYSKALELDPRHPQAPAIRFWLTSQ
jgi:Flp pilus assembly protein TadD